MAPTSLSSLPPRNATRGQFRPENPDDSQVVPLPSFSSFPSKACRFKPVPESWRYRSAACLNWVPLGCCFQDSASRINQRPPSPIRHSPSLLFLARSQPHRKSLQVEDRRPMELQKLCVFHCHPQRSERTRPTSSVSISLSIRGSHHEALHSVTQSKSTRETVASLERTGGVATGLLTKRQASVELSRE